MTAALAPFRWAFTLMLRTLQFCFLCYFLWAAYDIRLYAAKWYGMIIHEFDPWFNYRAAEYLAEHGLFKFFRWFDYESWYPLGRCVGCTIYPGMQMTAVVIWEGLKAIPEMDIAVPGAVRLLPQVFSNFLQSIGAPYVPLIPSNISLFPVMSVLDICVMMPAWFGSLASFFTGLLTYEVSRSANAALCAVGIMAVIPAHLMRSMAGEFDNEAVAMTAIVCTSWLWVRSVRTPHSWPFGILAGFSYIYMVAAWGGYIFVINIVGVHALLLVVLGRFNSGAHKAYSLFYVIGTYGATRVPVVGLTPLKSLEQMGPMGVFFGYQILQFCDWQRRKQKMNGRDFVKFRIQCMLFLLAGLVAVVALLWPTGYFGPISSRIRGLFVRHTKTGNPLVDSVAEHQPASAGVYDHYLHLPLSYAHVAALICLWNRNNAAYFAAIYAFIAMHFSGKMSRLVLICAPICTIGAGVWCGWCLDFILQPFLLLLGKEPYKLSKGTIDVASALEEPEPSKKDVKEGKETKGKKGAKENAVPKSDGRKGSKESTSSKKKRQSSEVELMEWDEDVRPGGMAMIKRVLKESMLDSVPRSQLVAYYSFKQRYDSSMFVSVRIAVSLVILLYLLTLSSTPQMWADFVRHSDAAAQSMANPRVVYKSKLKNGEVVIVRDYYDGYKWIDANTPKNARVIAWWDYGYQITGIAKRTSIADGNTWNHEHIATLGKVLTSSQKRAHNAIRHLADYVMVWAGGKDDLGKSPHLARIGNSVFPDHCGDQDPLCHKFGFTAQNEPTPMMQQSLLYNLVANKLAKDANADPKLFVEVHRTEFGKMRVYKVLNVSEESRAWIADPKNRVCDAPGSWYCVGQYPPALDKLISARKSFSQIEDFNKKGEKSAYTKLVEKQARSGQEF